MIIDGKKIAAELRKKLIQELVSLRLQKGRVPVLAVIIVGHNPASEIYVQHKQSACAEVGIESRKHVLSAAEASQADLLRLIERLNQDVAVDGILLQLPLPLQFNVPQLLEAIDPHKDVDGFHPYNIGRLAQRRPTLRPCTPQGVMALLEHIQCDFKNTDAVVVGCSNIVGQPMALELLSAGATVTVCHSHTRNLVKHLQVADLVISAVGKPGLIKGEWLKEGSTIIDVGITRLASGRLVGDIEFESAQRRAKWITPVPGGVGPMTVAMLLRNTLLAYQLKKY
ncbi:MAG: bifunctional methylenetetrahydrofolate dehydrogenase/methenyltetrahydrofolate cyclohydrolase FolD [Gammaproteobacteria bacterium]|nr:bifunctional methylenetetrahydrofolate dehydrogenase/methenyltetrahydrofolate cyclohydrolase FolD [Gammaproteobacteria bacterium]